MDGLGYNIGLFVHIVGAILMFVAMGIEVVCIGRMRRSATVEQAREWASVSGRLDPIFGVSTLLILAAGLYLTISNSLWGSGWVDLALATTLILGVVGPLVNGRKGKAIHRALVGGSGPLAGDLRSQVRDSGLWTSVLTMTGLATGIVFLMTVKPGFPGALIALVVFAVLGAAVAQATAGSAAAAQSDGIRAEPGR